MVLKFGKQVAQRPTPYLCKPVQARLAVWGRRPDGGSPRGSLEGTAPRRVTAKPVTGASAKEADVSGSFSGDAQCPPNTLKGCGNANRTARQIEADRMRQRQQNLATVRASRVARIRSVA